jgi:hypothetical protein
MRKKEADFLENLPLFFLYSSGKKLLQSGKTYGIIPKVSDAR